MGYFRSYNEYLVRMAIKTINTELNKQIGAKLHRVRLRSGQSQFHVAVDLNFSTTTYSKHENGKVDFTVTKLKELANHFGVYLRDFLDENIDIPRYIKDVRTPEDYKILEAKNELLKELLEAKNK
jgi:transcriptional regulator with XRE-family HTH domain